MRNFNRFFLEFLKIYFIIVEIKELQKSFATIEDCSISHSHLKKIFFATFNQFFEKTFNNILWLHIESCFIKKSCFSFMIYKKLSRFAYQKLFSLKIQIPFIEKLCYFSKVCFSKWCFKEFEEIVWRNLKKILIF